MATTKPRYDFSQDLTYGSGDATSGAQVTGTSSPSSAYPKELWDQLASSSGDAVWPGQVTGLSPLDSAFTPGGQVASWSSGQGLSADGVGALPGATFPTTPGEDPTIKKLTDQLIAMGRQDLADQIRGLEIGTANRQLQEGQIGLGVQGNWHQGELEKQNLASLINQLQQKTSWEQEQLGTDVGRLQSNAPYDINRIEGAFAGRGAAGSGQLGLETARYAEQMAQKIHDLETAAYQSGWLRQEQVGQAKRDFDSTMTKLGTENAQAELERQQLENQNLAAQVDVQSATRAFEEKLIGQEIQDQKELTADQTALAGRWLDARYIQLVAAGADPLTARTTAINEARAHWPQVNPTFIEGGLGIPSTGTEDNRGEAATWVSSRYRQLVDGGLSPAEAKAQAVAEAEEKYPGVDPTFIEGTETIAGKTGTTSTKPASGFTQYISGARAASFGPGELEEIQSGKFWTSPAANDTRSFAEQYVASGASPDPNTFLSALVTYIIRKRGNDPTTGKPYSRSQIIAGLEKYPRSLSLIMANAGIG